MRMRIARTLTLAAIVCSAWVQFAPAGEEGQEGKEPARVVSVIGEVMTPQNLPITEGMTLTEAVAAVGGLTEFAGKGRRVKIIRGGETTRYDLSDDGLDDPELKAGDVISVPGGG